MLNERDIQAGILRAARARELLDSSLLTEALDTIERDVVKLWGDAPQRDKEGKEALWQLYKTSQKFRSLLIGYLETGKYEQAQLAHYEKESKLRSLLRAV